MLSAKPKEFFFLFFFLFFLGNTKSEDFKRKEITGLTSSRVFSIARDSTGYLWLGTDEGLNRFDGIKNTKYKSNIFDSTTLSGNRIWKVFVDEKNRVWVINDRGIDLYNRHQNSFKRFNTKSRPLHILNEIDRVFVTTRQNGLFIINKNTEEQTNFSFDPLDPLSISSSRFSEKQAAPASANSNFLWLGTTNGLNKIDLQTQSAKRYYKEKEKAVESDTILAIHQIKDGILIGTSRGLVFYDEDKNETKKISDSSANNIVLIKEIEGVAALGRNSTLFLNKKLEVVHVALHKKQKNKIRALGPGQYLLWSSGDKETVVVSVGGTTKESFFSKTGVLEVVPEDILVDTESNIWIATKKGLFGASNIEKPVSFIQAPGINNTALFGRSKDSHTILIKNALYTSDSKNLKKLYEVQLPENKVRPTGIYVSDNKKTYLYNNNIYSLEKNKTTVIGGYGGTINTIAANDKHIIASIKNSGLMSVDLTNKKTYDHRANRLVSKNLPPGASSILLLEDTAWIGSEESGLYEVDISNIERPKLIEHHTYKRKNKNSFASSSVSCLHNHKSKLYIGTNGDGMFIYKGSGVFNRVSHADGLPSNNIISISSSSDTSLWILSKGGLSLFSTTGLEIKNIYKEEGLEDFLTTQNSLVTAEDGNALVVGFGGYYHIDKNLIYVNEHEPKIEIESIFLIDRNNRRFDAPMDNIQITYKTPTINIVYASPSFYKAKQTSYSYFVEGYNNSWINNGSRRYIELQGLDPGVYTANIKSYNSDGYESKNIARVSFQVVPPWWKTWWAYFLYASTILFVFAYYVGYQKRAQAKATEEKRKEEELEQARQFQLDMLPRETPDDLGLDISAAIETASEVGGDYYDYFPQKDKQSLYVVVGDATGHGMTAGMMVSITKAGLYGIPSIPPNDIAKRLNRVIKNIDLGWNRMAFNMARFWDNKVEFTSAAMPPVYHYHSSTGEVDEVLLGGLPLGSIKDETFALEEFDFNIGDSLVFISDGLPEAENSQGEMLGYEAVFDCVKTNGKESAEEQKQALLDLGSAWLGELRNQDDITIVVVKKSNPLD